MPTARKVQYGAVPLTPTKSLAWVGFADTGALTTLDTAGVLRVRLPDKHLGGSWMPILHVTSVLDGPGVAWPVSVGIDSLRCVVCPPHAPVPQVRAFGIVNYRTVKLLVAQVASYIRL